MIDTFVWLKWVHIVSSTMLFGFGAGTAYYQWSAHRTGDPRTIARVGRMVVRADWIFTGTSGVVQPATGFAMIYLTGASPFEPWLVLSYILFGVAFACWGPVVWLQIRAQRLAEEAARIGAPLGAAYHRAMRLWFFLGWPAFISLLAVYWLMVAKPDFSG